MLQSLLDTHRGGPYVLGGDLPDADARSYSSEHTGSFKGGAVPQHAARAMGGEATVDTLDRDLWESHVTRGDGYRRGFPRFGSFFFFFLATELVSPPHFLMQLKSTASETHELKVI